MFKSFKWYGVFDDNNGVCNERQMCGCDPGYIEFNAILMKCLSKYLSSRKKHLLV